MATTAAVSLVPAAFILLFQKLASLSTAVILPLTTCN